MANPNQGGGMFDDPTMRAALGLGLTVIGIWALYVFNRPVINYWLVVLNRIELFPFTFVSDMAREVHYKLGTRSPSQYSWSNISAQYAFTGRYLRWIFAPLLIGIGVWIMTYSVRLRYARKLVMNELIKLQAKEYPFITPIIDLNLADKPMHIGPWRSHERVIQWAVNKGLLFDKKDGKPRQLTNKRNRIVLPKTGLPNLDADIDRKSAYLDHEAAMHVLARQLGSPLGEDPFEGMRDYHRGLAAAFLAYGHGDKKAAYALLDRMAVSCAVDKVDKKTFRPLALDIEGADDLIARYRNSEEMRRYTANHTAWRNTFMVILLRFARRKGIVENAHYRWLRPVDRALYYALLQDGVPKRNGAEEIPPEELPFVESCAVFAHMEAEHALGRPLIDPEVRMALKGIQKVLYDEGWIDGEGGEE